MKRATKIGRQAHGKPLNIIDTARHSGIFQTFTRMLEGSPLEERLKSGKTFTLFAPADLSFAALPPKTLKQLLRAENERVLAGLLSYHALPVRLGETELKQLLKATTLHGAELVINDDDGLTVGGAKLVKADIEARNGVIHAIDRLLMPEGMPSLSSKRPPRRR